MLDFISPIPTEVPKIHYVQRNHNNVLELFSTMSLSSLFKLNWVKIVPKGHIYSPNKGISDLFLLV